MVHSVMQLEPSWQKVVEEELKQPYLVNLVDFLKGEYSGPKAIYPPKSHIFHALWKVPFERVRIVIIGQDPYHGYGQADGLSFSVAPGVPLPPSLLNIYKELESDLGVPIRPDGCLLPWAQQGILMLNAILTVREGEPLSHRGRGWERFTDLLVKKLGERDRPPIFLLWGRSAQEKCRQLKECAKIPSENFLQSPHPSPLSSYRGFFGSRPFSKINALLIKQGEAPIDW